MLSTYTWWNVKLLCELKKYLGLSRDKKMIIHTDYFWWDGRIISWIKPKGASWFTLSGEKIMSEMMGHF